MGMGGIGVFKGVRDNGGRAGDIHEEDAGTLVAYMVLELTMDISSLCEEYSRLLPTCHLINLITYLLILGATARLTVEPAARKL